MDPEIDIKHQFLDQKTYKQCQFLDGRPETDVMDQFLDPETDIMGTISIRFQDTGLSNIKQTRYRARVAEFVLEDGHVKAVNV